MDIKIKEMKQILLVLNVMLFCSLASTVTAQKFALINMEYILKRIPAYEMTNEQLEQLSKKWHDEIETPSKDIVQSLIEIL